MPKEDKCAQSVAWHRPARPLRMTSARFAFSVLGAAPPAARSCWLSLIQMSALSMGTTPHESEKSRSGHAHALDEAKSDASRMASAALWLAGSYEHSARESCAQSSAGIWHAAAAAGPDDSVHPQRHLAPPKANAPYPCIGTLLSPAWLLRFGSCCSRPGSIVNCSLDPAGILVEILVAASTHMRESLGTWRMA